MTKEGAEKYALDTWGGGNYLSDYEAVIKLRGPATTFLPEIDDYGNHISENDWAYMDASEKADTDLYGSIRYFCDMKRGWVKEDK